MSLRPDDVGEGRLRVSLRNSSSALVGGLHMDTSSHPHRHQSLSVRLLWLPQCTLRSQRA